MKVEEKLARNAIRNARESHIRLDQAICRRCVERPCIRLCPGRLYALCGEKGEMKVEYAGCLECGTCKIVCGLGAVSWEYPEGGFGVQYRYG